MKLAIETCSVDQVIDIADWDGLLFRLEGRGRYVDRIVLNCDRADWNCPDGCLSSEVLILFDDGELSSVEGFHFCQRYGDVAQGVAVKGDSASEHLDQLADELFAIGEGNGVGVGCAGLSWPEEQSAQ